MINGNGDLVVSFGGLALKFGGILPFEFLNYLSSIYKNSCDLIFYIDKHQCWYHKGIEGITNNIDDTVIYLNNIIKNGNYEKVIYIGTSAGGYASILFGSLCNNINYVISFIPQTIIKNPIDIKYSNLKNIINKNTKYILCGDTFVQNVDGLHHISQCKNIQSFKNVKIININGVDLKKLRDNGFIKNMIDNILLK